MENIGLAIIEDNTLTRESLEGYFGAHPALKIIIVADSMEAFFEKTIPLSQGTGIDLLLLDIGLPGISGIDGIHQLRQKFPDMDIVMLTNFEENELIFKSLCAGACSYISKRTPLSTIQEAIFTIHRGGSYMSPAIARKVVEYFMPKASNQQSILTARQQEIVEGLVDGLSYKLIAERLGISIDTVRDHIKHIYKALEVNSRTEVIRRKLDGKI